MSIRGDFIAQAQYESQYHLQVELDKNCRANDADFRSNHEGRLGVRGKVMRIFRGDRELSLGDVVTFNVSIRKEEIPLYGSRTIWAKQFDEAEFMEVFLDGEPPDLQVAQDCFYLIAEITPEPTVSIDIDLARKAALERGTLLQRSELAIERRRRGATYSPNPITKPRGWWKFWR